MHTSWTAPDEAYEDAVAAPSSDAVLDDPDGASRPLAGFGRRGLDAGVRVERARPEAACS